MLLQHLRQIFGALNIATATAANAAARRGHVWPANASVPLPRRPAQPPPPLLLLASAACNAQARPMSRVPGRTHRGAAKRFRLTSAGDVLHWAAGRRHLLSGKSRRRLTRNRGARRLAGGDAKHVRRLLRG